MQINSNLLPTHTHTHKKPTSSNKNCLSQGPDIRISKQKTQSSCYKFVQKTARKKPKEVKGEYENNSTAGKIKTNWSLSKVKSLQIKAHYRSGRATQGMWGEKDKYF